jgi:hypothetical protein
VNRKEWKWGIFVENVPVFDDVQNSNGPIGTIGSG